MEPTRISDAVWEIDREDDMRVPGRIYASDAIMEAVLRDRSVDQVANAAHLPGIVEASFAMPDIHWGYGFPIGGVAATDIDDGGVVSPGRVRPSISVPWASPFSSPGPWEPRRSVRRRMVKAG